MSLGDNHGRKCLFHFHEGPAGNFFTAHLVVQRSDAVPVRPIEAGMSIYLRWTTSVEMPLAHWEDLLLLPMNRATF